jgi:hypothetical protein
MKGYDADASRRGLRFIASIEHFGEPAVNWSRHGMSALRLVGIVREPRSSRAGSPFAKFWTRL